MLSKLEELRTSLREDSSHENIQKIAKEVDSLAQHNFLSDISVISQKEVCGIIRNEAYKNNFGSIFFMMKGVENPNDEYYYEDGYGNFHTLTADHLDAILYDCMNELN